MKIPKVQLHMSNPDDKYVYHGSKDLFKTAIPKRQIRKRIDKLGNIEVIFNKISFHASPYKWLALAYTFDPDKPCPEGGENSYYHIGVDLYKHNEVIEIFGTGSLEKSLQKLYGEGGYLMTFKKEGFYHSKGLGDLEVVTDKSIRPIKTERIDGPVAELRKRGISFRFIDLANVKKI